MDWKNIRKGPWHLTLQPNKWAYLNNPRWLASPRTFVRGGPDDYDGREDEEPEVWEPEHQPHFPSNNFPKHHQCGHWHRPVVPITSIPTTVPPTTAPPGETSIETFFELCSATGWGAGDSELTVSDTGVTLDSADYDGSPIFYFDIEGQNVPYVGSPSGLNYAHINGGVSSDQYRTTLLQLRVLREEDDSSTTLIKEIDVSPGAALDDDLSIADLTTGGLPLWTNGRSYFLELIYHQDVYIGGVYDSSIVIGLSPIPLFVVTTTEIRSGAGGILSDYLGDVPPYQAHIFGQVTTGSFDFWINFNGASVELPPIPYILDLVDESDNVIATIAIPADYSSTNLYFSRSWFALSSGSHTYKLRFPVNIPSQTAIVTMARIAMQQTLPTKSRSQFPVFSAPLTLYAGSDLFGFTPVYGLAGYASKWGDAAKQFYTRQYFPIWKYVASELSNISAIELGIMAGGVHYYLGASQDSAEDLYVAYFDINTGTMVPGTELIWGAGDPVSKKTAFIDKDDLVDGHEYEIRVKCADMVTNKGGCLVRGDLDIWVDPISKFTAWKRVGRCNLDQYFTIVGSYEYGSRVPHLEVVGAKSYFENTAYFWVEHYSVPGDPTDYYYSLYDDGVNENGNGSTSVEVTGSRAQWNLSQMDGDRHRNRSGEITLIDGNYYLCYNKKADTELYQSAAFILTVYDAT